MYEKGSLGRRDDDPWCGIELERLDRSTEDLPSAPDGADSSIMKRQEAKEGEGGVKYTERILRLGRLRRRSARRGKVKVHIGRSSG